MPQQATSLSMSNNEVDFNEFIQKLLFTNDVTTVDNFYKTKVVSFRSPEHELWFEVLREGVYDYIQNIDQNTTAQKRLFEEIFNWFFNEHDEKWPLSFENICECLDIEVNYWRRLLIQWTQRYFKEKNPEPVPIILPPPLSSMISNKFVDIESILPEELLDT